MTAKPKVNLVTLGCAKNLVDSEYLAKQLDVNGFSVQHESRDFTQTVIINTCGFINDAKQESIDTIMHFIEAKKSGKISSLYVMGCLSQRYKEELQNEIPEVDGFYGVEQQRDILTALKSDYSENTKNTRLLATPSHYAYLKIAEGCNRRCSFCSIPHIRGNYKSKSLEDLYEEACQLATDEKIKELNLIAQDLSYYGYDLYKQHALPELLRKISSLDTLQWIRLLYFYPANFPYSVLDVMNEKDNICNYLDIPFQHISDIMLEKMRRGIDSSATQKLIDLIRTKVPGVHLRTTLLVGHPGETDKEFKQLLDFVKEVKFDRLGVFTYSEEEGTYSAKHFKDDIPQNIKEERAEQVMKLQQQIALTKNESKIGSTIPVLIEREDGDNYYGRTEADAPEVDNEVIIPMKENKLTIGSFYDVKVTSAYEYDLIGEVKT